MGWYATCKFCGETAKHAAFSCRCQQKEDQRITTLMKGSTLVNFFAAANPYPVTIWHINREGRDYYFIQVGRDDNCSPGWSEINKERYDGEVQERENQDKHSALYVLFNDILVSLKKEQEAGVTEPFFIHQEYKITRSTTGSISVKNSDNELLKEFEPFEEYHEYPFVDFMFDLTKA